MKLYSLKENLDIIYTNKESIDFLNKTNMFLIVITTLSIFIILIDLYLGIVISLLIYTIIKTLIYTYALLKRKIIIGRIEAELPYFLKDLDISLSMGRDFNSAIAKSSSKYRYLNEIFKYIIDRINKGESPYKSFLYISNKYKSEILSRSLNQISNSYDSGYKNNIGGPLYSLSEEIISIQRNEIKLFSSKLVIISIVFIAVSAIIPAMILIFVTVSGPIMDTGISDIGIILIYSIILPIISVAIIMSAYIISPDHTK